MMEFKANSDTIDVDLAIHLHPRDGLAGYAADDYGGVSVDLGPRGCVSGEGVGVVAGVPEETRFRVGSRSWKLVNFRLIEYRLWTKSMNAALWGALMEFEVLDTRIYVENYGPVAPPDNSVAGIDAEATVRLKGATVSAEQTVLNAVRVANGTPPYSCESDVYGACRTQLRHRKIHLRARMALTDAEVSGAPSSPARFFPSPRSWPWNMIEYPLRFFPRWSLLVVSAALLLTALACSSPAPTQIPEPTATKPVEAPAPTQAPEPAPVESIEAPSPLEEAIQATLSTQGSTVVMDGDVDIGFYERFLTVVRGREDEITTLRVNSGGGVTDEGRNLGAWIFEHSVDVVVDGLCFSSCANYVFTAGRNKTIMAGSIVGWHGSEQQDEHIARGLDVTVEELLGRQYDESAAEWGETPSSEGRKSFVEDVLSGMPVAVTEENAFLKKIGVSVDALVYGFLPDQFEDYYVNAPPEIDGWTFSIEDMASFGIDNVTYAGDGDYPSERARAVYGVILLEVP